MTNIYLLSELKKVEAWLSLNEMMDGSSKNAEALETISEVIETLEKEEETT
jgi:hypothetical protein